MKKGLLIVNIGTPENYSTKSVGSYLKKFLMDEDVISIPFVFRWILVHFIIVPFRASKSAAKYKKIWTSQGSPLKVITDAFVKNLQINLTEYHVKAGMTFSEPSLMNSLLEFKKEDIDEITICPMFPQYADATTGSILKNIKKISASIELKAQLKAIKPFFNQEFYINELADICRQSTQNKNIQHWIFSYHGLPESQITQSKGCQLDSRCCLSQSACTLKCYRSHSVQTTHALAQKLNLKTNEYSMTFQSRLGAKKWLQPYTDVFLKENSARLQNVAIVCPAFVADCLETLEEINIENRAVFLEHGGNEFHYIPCLNTHSSWVNQFSHYVQQEQNLTNL